MSAILLASTLLPAAFQAAQGFIQRGRAKKLKESTYIPAELQENKALAQQQAFSRRAPGQGRSEELVRRNLSTAIAANNRSAGGDVNKSAALNASAVARADDAVGGLQAQGAQFSENAFARMAQANLGIAGQKRQNRDDYTRTKSDLIAASDQNFFNALSGIGSAGVAFGLNGGFKGKTGQSTTQPGTPTTNNVGMNPYQSFLPGGMIPDPNNPYGTTYMGPRAPFHGPQFYPSPVFRKK